MSFFFNIKIKIRTLVRETNIFENKKKKRKLLETKCMRTKIKEITTFVLELTEKKHAAITIVLFMPMEKMQEDVCIHNKKC
jgi:hypothetical protein